MNEVSVIILTYSHFASLIIGKVDLGSVRLVPNVESGYLNHLR